MSLSMNQMCRNAYCKSKVREYRELTSKQYEDIDSLKSYITDQENFLPQVFQARNKLQEHLANLDLLDKIEQLDEDMDTWVELSKKPGKRI